jgi:hypothetical protein
MPKLSEVTGEKPRKLKLSQVQAEEPKPFQPRKRSLQDLQQAAKVHDSTDGMSDAQVFFAGAGKSLVDTGRGIKQLYHMAQDKFAPRQAGIADVIAGRDVSRQAQDRREQDAIEERDGSLMGNGYGLAGNIAGNVAQVLSPGVVFKGAATVPALARAAPALQAASRASLPTTVRGAATQGAALGFLQPVGSDDSRALNTGAGAAFGAAGAAVPRALGGLARLVRGNGVTKGGTARRVAEVLRAEASNPAALEQAAPSAIPGVQRTLAQESVDPGISRLERLLRSKTRGWDELDASNDQARREAIGAFSGDVGAAMAERDAMSAPFLRAAMQHNGVDTSRLLGQLERAQGMYEGRPAVQTTLRGISDLLYRPANAAEKRASPNWPDLVPRDEVSQLYNVRKTLGDLMSGKLRGEQPAAEAATRELMMVKNGIDRAIGKTTPMFKGYLEAYKQGSREVDRRKLGQLLLEKGAGSNNADALTPSAFNGLANNLDAAAAKATGFRKARAGNILESEDIATIQAISDDLKRVAATRTLGSGGNSQTFERFAGEGRLRGRLLQAIPGISKITELLDSAAQSRLERNLAEVLQNPSKARAVLAKLPANERKLVENALVLAGGTAGAVAIPSAK